MQSYPAFVGLRVLLKREFLVFPVSRGSFGEQVEIGQVCVEHRAVNTGEFGLAAHLTSADPSKTALSS